jgi:hypothetical protein
VNASIGSIGNEFDLKGESPVDIVNDVPEWSKGDDWVYDMNFSITIEDKTFKLEIPVRFLVTRITEDAYNLDIRGTGVFGMIKGNASIRKSDLAIMDFSIYSKGEMVFDYEINATAIFDPPFDIMIFPLNVGDVWVFYTIADIDFLFYLENVIDPPLSYSSNIPLAGVFECVDKGNVSVPAGTFEAFHIKRLVIKGSGIEFWYSKIVGNIIKMNIPDISIKNITIGLQMKLLSYTTSALSVEIEKPEEGYIYAFDRKIMPTLLGNTVIIGKITVEAVVQSEFGMDKVEFYVDDSLGRTDEGEPYEWLWDESIVGLHAIKVRAYDIPGNIASDEIEVIIFNFDG